MASKIIKGLTVEIGGDTTKLGKALEDVEGKGRDLSKELGQINKLLKLDPGNTELVAQKQKVLAEAIETTRKKLDTLKAAEKQVQEQFERGEASEEQLRALQREIIETTKKLEGYENAAKETGEGMDELEKEEEEAGEAADGLGSKVGSLAKGGLKALGAAVVSVVTALVGCAEATREYRTEMGKLDTAFTTAGHSSEAATKTYKTLQGVLGETDQAVEAANHLAKLTDNEKDLEKWTDICTGVYATFGASLPIEGLTEAANETAKTGALTGSLADALNWAGVSEDDFQAKLDACSTEQERQALITETLNGLYSETAAKYRETNAELIRANEANEAWTASMAEAGAAIEPILTDVKLLGASLLSELMPGVKGVADAFRGILNGDEGAAAGVGEALSGIISQLLNKITELLPTVAQVATSLVTTLTTTLLNSLPSILQTLVDVATQIVNSLAAYLPTLLPALLEAALGIVDLIINNIPVVLDACVAVIEGIIAALPQMLQMLTDRLPELINDLLYGVLPEIITLITEKLPQLITSICSMLVTFLPDLLNAAVYLFQAIVEAIPLIIEQLAPQIPVLVDSIISGLIDLIPVLLEGAVQLLHAIVEAIPILLETLLPQIPMIVETIVSGLAEMAPTLLAAAVTLLWEIIKAIPQIVAALFENLPQILEAITSVLGALPSLLWKILLNVISKVVEFGSNAASKAKTAAKNILDAIVNGVKSLPDKMKNIGKNLVEGLWNGIKNMVSWVKNKIKGFSKDVLNGIKSFFGVNSPSKETEWIGDMLDRGLAKGVIENMDAPLDAMADVADGMLGEADSLNGLTLERQLNHTFSADNAAAETGLLGRLDNILAAIERGQILTLDGDALVGGTADRMNNRLGQLRVLAARGAM